MTCLIIVRGESAGRQFELGKRPLSIGRDPARDIQLLDPKVSRKHALLRFDGGEYVIAAAKPRNGLEINGRRLDTETALQDGDEILLGDTLIRYVASSDPDRTNALFGRKAADRDAREAKTIGQ